MCRLWNIIVTFFSATCRLSNNLDWSDSWVCCRLFTCRQSNLWTAFCCDEACSSWVRFRTCEFWQDTKHHNIPQRSTAKSLMTMDLRTEPMAITKQRHGAFNNTAMYCNRGQAGFLQHFATLPSGGSFKRWSSMVFRFQMLEFIPSDLLGVKLSVETSVLENRRRSPVKPSQRIQESQFWIRGLFQRIKSTQLPGFDGSSPSDKMGILE